MYVCTRTHMCADKLVREQVCMCVHMCVRMYLFSERRDVREIFAHL